MPVAAASGAFASFEAKWLRANPEQAVVAVFLAPRERRLAAAFGALVNELDETLFGVREPQVAAAKLEWWQQELAGIAGGTGRHPITRELIEAGAPPQVSWPHLAGGALALLDAAAPPSLDAAFDQLAAFYAPVAAAEAALFTGARNGVGDADLWTSSHLLSAAAGCGRLPDRVETFPLDLFARHGVTRGEMARSGAKRTLLLADFLNGLGERIAEALERNRGASLGRRVRARLDFTAARAAARRDDPAGFLADATPSRWRMLWLSWREARARAAATESPPA